MNQTISRREILKLMTFSIPSLFKPIQVLGMEALIKSILPSNIDSLEKLEGALRWITNPNNEKYGFTEHEKSAFYYHNLNSGEELNINGSEKMQLASLIKVPIALLYQKSIESGIRVDNKKFSPEFNLLEKKCFKEMLVNSDNIATNYLMKQLGGPKNIQRHLEELFPDIFENKINITNYIPLTKDEFPEAKAKGLPTNVPGLELDNEFYYTNTCKPEAIGEVFVKLYKKEFIGSELILNHLGLKKSNLYRMWPDIIPHDVKIIGKTGTTGRHYSVFGIVNSEIPYVFGGIIERNEKLPGGFIEWQKRCDLYGAMRAASGNAYRYVNGI
jgi:hypothetical protein